MPIQLSNPDNKILSKQIRQSTGTISITAEKDGRHEYCFSNQMSALADKIVRYAHISAVFARCSDALIQLQCPRNNICRRRWWVRCSSPRGSLPISATADVVAPIEREIRLLSNGLTAVKDEQEYIVVREKTHRNTAESTNSRVKWWSVLQAIVLFLVVGWQIYYLKVSPACNFGRLHRFNRPSSHSSK
jgi:hypothetical protein